MTPDEHLDLYGMQDGSLVRDLRARITALEADLARAHRLHEETKQTLEAQVARTFTAEDVERAITAMHADLIGNTVHDGWFDVKPFDLDSVTVDGQINLRTLTCAALAAVGRVEP